ncbi:MAG TPA: molybdate ABC transporter permease subunit [Acidobacteriaceae bacterium]
MVALITIAGPAAATLRLPAWQVDGQALALTLELAAVTTVILIVIAVPLAAFLIFGHARLRPILEAAAMLPLVLPPTVLGFYLLVLLGPHTSVGRALIHLLGHPLAFSFAGLVVGSVLYSLPFALQPLTSGFAQLPVQLLETSTLLGAGPLRTLRRVVLPLAQRSLLASAVLSFTHTVGEFGVVLMLGGDIPGRTRTLSIALLDQVQDGRFTAANQTALLLLAGSALVLVLVYLVPRGGAFRASRLQAPSGLRSPDLTSPEQEKRQHA